MCNKFRKKKHAKKCAAVLAVLLTLALCSATVFGTPWRTGNIINDDHDAWDYGKYQMNKTLRQTDGGGGMNWN